MGDEARHMKRTPEIEVTRTRVSVDQNKIPPFTNTRGGRPKLQDQGEQPQ